MLVPPSGLKVLYENMERNEQRLALISFQLGKGLSQAMVISSLGKKELKVGLAVNGPSAFLPKPSRFRSRVLKAEIFAIKSVKETRKDNKVVQTHQECGRQRGTHLEARSTVVVLSRQLNHHINNHGPMWATPNYFESIFEFLSLICFYTRGILLKCFQIMCGCLGRDLFGSSRVLFLVSKGNFEIILGTTFEISLEILGEVKWEDVKYERNRRQNPVEQFQEHQKVIDKLSPPTVLKVELWYFIAPDGLVAL
ncbi:hypothetical protein Syun_027861 [Stephania yunnanensis]|uniref:Uncharacterized protein n=1 Tax=Stephania yunnanensis TaxID=152371 RepID=A0AAP0EGB5_9MAGN